MKKAACCLIFSKGRKEVLLIKRRDLPVWVIPGGGIDEGESPEEAARREVHEESGYSVSITRQVAEYSPVNFLTQTTYLFEGIILGGAATTGNETKEVAFFPPDRLPKEMPPSHRFWIADALKNLPEIIHAPVRGASFFDTLKALITHPLIIIRFFTLKIIRRSA